MRIRILTIMTLVMTLLMAFNAQARKPAVEPVAGIESESYSPTSKGMEVQFNFGNHVEATQVFRNQSPSMQTPSWIATSTLIAFVLLPFLMWFGISQSLKNINMTTEETVITHQDEVQETVTPENVHKLEDYKTTKKDSGKKAA